MIIAKKVENTDLEVVCPKCNSEQLVIAGQDKEADKTLDYYGGEFYCRKCKDLYDYIYFPNPTLFKLMRLVMARDEKINQMEDAFSEISYIADNKMLHDN